MSIVSLMLLGVIARGSPPILRRARVGADVTAICAALAPEDRPPADCT